MILEIPVTISIVTAYLS